MPEIDISKLFGDNFEGGINNIISAIDKLTISMNQLGDATKKSISESEKELKKLDKQLKDTNSDRLNDNKKLLSTIDEEIENNKKLQAQLKKLEDQIKKLKKAKDDSNEQSKEASRLAKERVRLEAKLSAGLSDQAKKNVELKLRLQEQNKEAKKTAKETLGLVDAYAKLAQSAAKAKREAKALAAQFGVNSVQAQKAAKSSNALSDRLKSIDSSLGDNQRNVGNYSSALGNLKEGFGSLLSSLSPAALGVAAVTAGIAGIAKGVEGIIEINKQLREVAQLTKLSGTALESVTAGIRATSGAFDVEFKETLKAANTLTKEFGIESAEAIGLINLGLIQGANINDDFLDQIREYSTQFRNAGVEAEALVAVISLSAQEGIFSDKLADTIKEGDLRLKKFAKTTSDALIPLGKFRNEQIKQAAAAGNSFEAIQLISKGLSEVSLTAKETQDIISDVFGGPGEDAGLRAIKLLGTINTEQDKILEGLTDRQKRQFELLKVQEQVAKAQVEIASNFTDSGSEIALIWEKVKLVLLQAVNDIINAFKPLISSVIDGFKAFSRLGNVIGKFTSKTDESKDSMNVFSKILRVIIRLWQFQIKVYTKVINSIAEFIEENKAAQAVVSFLGDAIGLFLDGLLALPNALSGTFSAIKAFFVGIKEAAFAQLSGIGDVIIGVFTLDAAKIQEGREKGGKAILKFGEDIKKAFLKGWNSFSLPDEASKEIDEVKKEGDKLTNSILKNSKSVGDANKPLRTRIQLMKELTKVQQDLNKEQSKTFEDQSPEKINKLNSEIATLNELIGFSEKKYKELGEVAEPALQKMEVQTIELTDAQKAQNEASEEAFEREERNEQRKAQLVTAVSDGIQKRLLLESQLLNEQAQGAATAEERDELLRQSAESRLKAEQRAALVSAFTAEINKSGDAGKALTASLETFAALKVVEGVASFHDGGYFEGYTGGGGEWQGKPVMLHGQEFVNNKKQVDTYSMHGWSSSDFDKAIDTNYFGQFAKTSDMLGGSTPTIINSAPPIDYARMGKEVGKNVPVTDLAPLAHHLVLRNRQGNKTRETVIKNKYNMI